jgi:hypothetical protein
MTSSLFAELLKHYRQRRCHRPREPMVMPICHATVRLGCPCSSDFQVVGPSDSEFPVSGFKRGGCQKVRQAGWSSFFGGARQYAAAHGSAGRQVVLIRKKVFKNPWYG